MKRFYPLSLCVLALFAACGSDDVKNDGRSGTDSGGTDSGKSDTGTDAGAQDTGVQDGTAQDTGTDTGVVDAGFNLNGCTDMSFVDKSSGNQSVRTVDWDLSQNFP